MDKILLYHNPKWGKSRGSVEILERFKLHYQTIEYLKNPLSIQELRDISKKLSLDPKDFIRKSDSIFKELSMEKYLNDNEKMFALISKNIRVMERPLVFKGNKGIIARPPEKIIEFLDLD